MKRFALPLTKSNLFLIAILILAFFLRAYNIKNNVMFQGDQGRDALIVSQIFKNQDPVFIGPMTSIGNMYLGPFYYYFMLPFLWLSYPSPLGPVYAVIAVSVATVYLLYQIGKKLFGQQSAVLATTFFALSANAIIYSRFSWNPNIAPFFGLLMFYFTYIAWQKDSRYWILVSLMFSVLIQLHYVTLLSAAGAGIILLIQIFEKIKLRENKDCWQKLIFSLTISLLVFLISLTPLILFDFKHDFLNSQAFVDILSSKESFELSRTNQQHGLAAVGQFLTLDLKNKASQVILETSFAVDTINHPLLYIITILTVSYFLKVWKKKEKIKPAELVLLAYLGSGILGIALYQHNVYLHYIAYLFPMVYLFYGLFFAKIKRFYSLLILIPFFIYFLLSNSTRYQLKSSGWTIADMQNTADQIYKRVKPDDKYNLVLLSESKDLYGMNYRYFLSTKDNEPLALANHHQADTLFIINEEKVEKEVWQLPIYEIVVFEEKNVAEIFQIKNGPEITVLRTEKTDYN